VRTEARLRAERERERELLHGTEDHGFFTKRKMASEESRLPCSLVKKYRHRR